MNKGKSEQNLVIVPAENGFLVRPEYEVGSQNNVCNWKVFQTMEELITFLKENYAHRNTCVTPDLV